MDQQPPPPSSAPTESSSSQKPPAPSTSPRSTNISSAQQEQPPPPSSSSPPAEAAAATSSRTAVASWSASVPPSFARRKAAILAQLALPDEEYADLSPKGTVDAGIRELIGEINAREGLVTTSSCAGRVSVFLEGRRRPQGLSDSNGVDAGDDGDQRLPGHLFAVDEEGAEEERGHDGGSGSVGVGTVAGVGGKGGGGRWLFVSHDPVETNGKLDSEPNIVAALLGMDEPIFDGREDSLAEQMSGGSARLIHFKFEPMILHVLTASPQHAQLLLRCGLQAGFRESGAINLLPPASSSSSSPSTATPMVAIRSMGLALESLIGRETNGIKHCTVSGEYLKALIKIANDRFVENARRIERFRALLSKAGDGVNGKKVTANWEDAEVRRERKRAEGLKRAEEARRLKGEQQKEEEA